MPHPWRGGAKREAAPDATPATAMAPPAVPRETAKERRLAQQRDALAQAVSLAQQGTEENVVRVELLRGELVACEQSLSRAQSELRRGAAEREAIHAQLTEMSGKMRMAQQANAKLRGQSIPRPRSAGGASGGACSATSRLSAPTASSAARGRGAFGGGGPFGSLRMATTPGDVLATPVPGSASSEPSDGAVAAAVVVAAEGGLMAEAEAAREEHLEAISREQQAELAGLRAQVVALQTEMTEAAERQRREMDGGEHAYAAQRTHLATSALHARLMWAEAHDLEAELSDARLALGRAQAEVAELREGRDPEAAGGGGGHQRRAYRAAASNVARARRPAVLARNSKEFLDGKHAVERDKQALEALVAELEAKEKAATKETKERGKQLRAAAEEAQQLRGRISTLEKQLRESKVATETGASQASQAAKQARADREVLVDCIRQMSSQLAAARAQAEAAGSQVLSTRADAEEAAKKAEEELTEARDARRRLETQLAECERQLESEVERAHAQREETAQALQRAAAREAELEEQAKRHEEALRSARRESESQLATAAAAAARLQEARAAERSRLRSSCCRSSRPPRARPSSSGRKLRRSGSGRTRRRRRRRRRPNASPRSPRRMRRRTRHARRRKPRWRRRRRPARCATSCSTLWALGFTTRPTCAPPDTRRWRPISRGWKRRSLPRRRR